MKKNIKRIIPVVVAVSTLVGAMSINAEENSTLNSSESTTVVSSESKQDSSNETKESSTENTTETIETTSKVVEKELAPNQIEVFGKLINGKTIYSQGTLLMPTRAVFEALGFEIEWNNEYKMVTLTNLPSYITFTIGKDGYTIARTAPMPLGHAPINIDGVTYVPVSLLTEIMQMEGVSVYDNNSLRISEVKEQAEETKEKEEKEEKVDLKLQIGKGKIVSIDKSNNQILINDENMGEVVLNLSKDTLTVFETNATQLAVGQYVIVEYSPAMTLSLPPINNPVKINIVSKEKFDQTVIEVVTEETTADESTTSEAKDTTSKTEETTETTTSK